MARRDYPTREKLTVEEAERMVNMLASGPLFRRPVDAGLLRKRWLQVYEMMDGSTEYLEPTDVAHGIFYEKNGSIKPYWLQVPVGQWYQASTA